MCGIVGKYNFLSQAPVDPGLIKTMSDQVFYRGPDDAGIYIDGPVGMGHRRLSIIDLSPLGHQPMSSIDGNVWITFNGEIYNFLSLREDLAAKGYHFKSHCDTEVIINLYLEYGEDCLKYLRGMFAFAIWDKRKSKLFLARDRIGKKPLFYFYDGNTFIFASEIKSILKDPVVKREINFEAFSDYFKYQYVPDPKTIYKNIFKLKPGYCMVCTPEGIQDREYWDISFSQGSDVNLDDTCEQLLEVLKESVKLRMISDVPLGAFLSGGIDSSGIVALMAGFKESPVTTCSIGFDTPEYDEIRFARVIAEKFKTDHHEFMVKQKAASILRNLAYHFDEPFADSSSVPTYYVSKLAREKVTVALSGDGGDENFAGYEKYYIDDIENRIRSAIPGPIRRSAFPFLAGRLAGQNWRILQKAYTLFTTLGVAPDYGFYLTNTNFDDNLWARMINDDTRRRIGGYDPFSVTQYYYHRADTDNHLSKILYADLKTYLPGDILVKVDRMSMANSLETRAPILDHKVIEFAAGIRPDFKYNKGDKKFVLKETFKNILPAGIMNRKKMGFSVPLAQWMRGELKEFTEVRLFNKNAGVMQFFQHKPLQEIWNLHQTGKRDFGTVLWTILMFELWHENFMA